MPRRTRLANAPERTEPRGELRRFLGGIPFSHIRGVTKEERRALLGELLPYGLVTLALVGLFAWLASLWWGLTIVLLTVGAILALVPAFFLYSLWPQIQTLRSGRIHVYIGPLRGIAAFDVVQEHFQGRHTLDAHLNRHIEVLALGSGERIWRLEGIPVQGALRSVRSIRLALLPDLDERGERLLTEEEAHELKGRARDFRRVGAFTVRNLLAFLFTTKVFALLVLIATPSVAVIVAAYLVAAILAWGPYPARRKFAKVLRGDLAAGTVRDGFLASGMPWVVNGEPARWRIGGARGGSRAVTKDRALALEEEEQEDEDEELFRQALAASGPWRGNPETEPLKRD